MLLTWLRHLVVMLMLCLATMWMALLVSAYCRGPRKIAVRSGATRMNSNKYHSPANNSF